MSAAETTVAQSSPQPAPAVPHRRWRFQFSLKTLAIFMLLVGVGLGSLGRLIYRARVQETKVATLRSFGVSVEYEGEFRIGEDGTVWFVGEFRPWWKQELVKWCGEDVVCTVQGLTANWPRPLSDHDRDEFWRLAASCPELRKLEVSQYWFDTAGMARFRGNTTLKSLTLLNASLTNEDMAIIGTLTELRRLYLWGGYKRTSRMDDRGVASLDPLEELRDLCLDDSGITNESMPHIATHQRLQSLGLLNTCIADEGAHSLAGLTDLKTLSLYRSNITDQGLMSLSGLTQLKFLGLSGTEVSDEGLQHLGTLVELETLDIGETKIHGPGLAALAALPKLNRVRLGKNLVKDDDLCYFEGLRQLELLDLEKSLVTDAGIMTIRLGPNVFAINISGTAVTDEGLMSLVRFPQLQELEVEQSGITPEGIAMFKRRSPKSQFGLSSPVSTNTTKPLE